MKKILIFSHALEIGGAEKALLGLLETIDTTKYQVDLFLMRHQGELLKYVPKGINLLPESKQYSCLAIPISEVIKKGQIRIALGRWRGKRAAAKRVSKLELGDNDVGLEYSHKYVLHAMPPISNTEYDLAISFLTPHYFVAEKVKAKKKIAWIHTDYSKVQIDKKSQERMWNKYDHIASISDKAAEEFKRIFPALSNKVITIENILPLQYINRIKDEFTVEKEMPDDGAIKLLSIGRFCTAKNFDNIPLICKHILQENIAIKWYIIGFGGDENLIKSRIAEYGMQENVIILGKKENPYPYIKACDIYVQPSRYEGKCVSVIEAQALHKPVIISDYSTASSQLKNNYDGMIVPLDNEKCAERIVNVINDKLLQQMLIENTRKQDYTQQKEVEKLYGIIN